jgi:hypothetical protein
LRVELEAAGLLRAEDAFALLRAEPAFELLRAAEFELVRAEPELELRRLELAGVVPLSLAAGRLRSPAFGEALCFVLVCLATSRPLYGRCNEAHVHATSIAAACISLVLAIVAIIHRIRRTPRGDLHVSGSVGFMNAARSVPVAEHRSLTREREGLCFAQPDRPAARLRRKAEPHPACARAATRGRGRPHRHREPWCWRTGRASHAARVTGGSRRSLGRRGGARTGSPRAA